MSFEDFPNIVQSHVQSDKSQRALESIFCLPDFIARRQQPDYGKDYDIELCANSGAINVQFAVQLKSIDGVEVVSTGRMVSYPMETSRLNYLTQSPCGAILVLYDARTEKLFYEWVNKLVEVLDQGGIQWRGQKTATVHLPVENVLDHTSKRTIHAYVCALHKQILTARSADSLSGIVGRTTRSLPSFNIPTSQEEILALLLSEGIALVAGGYQNEVLAAYSAIPSVRWGTNAVHLLTLAFAYEHSGLPLQSLSFVNGALSCRAQPLPINRQVLAEQLRLISRFMLGQIKSVAYHQELEDLVNRYPDSDEAKEIRLELFLFELIRPGGRSERIEDIFALTNEARKLVGEETDWGLHLRLAKVEFAAGDKCNLILRFQSEIAKKVGFPISINRGLEVAKLALDLKQAGLRRIARIGEETEKAKRFDVYALCRFELALHGFSMFVVMRMLDSIENQSDEWKVTEKGLINNLLIDVDTAAGIFEKMGFQIQHVKALSLKADILSATGDRTTAQTIIETARKKGKILGLDLEAHPLWQTPTPVSLDDKDVGNEIIDATEDDLRAFADNLREALALPESRVENILKDVKVYRLVRREKQRWCKHIEILEDKMHTRSLETYFAVDPDRACICQKYGYDTKLVNTDTELTIKAFKETYCEKCEGREI